MAYSDLLKDPRWQKRRLKVLERDGWKCRCCNAEDRQLQVHHLKYHGKPWDAPDEHLETLCVQCHQWRTDFDSIWGTRSLVCTRFWKNMVLFFTFVSKHEHEFVNSNSKGYSTDLLETLRLRWRDYQEQRPAPPSTTQSNPLPDFLQ